MTPNAAAAVSNAKHNRRRRVVPVTVDRRAPGSRAIDPVDHAAEATVRTCVFGSSEMRRMMTTHVVGSNVNYPAVHGAFHPWRAGQTLVVDAGIYTGDVTIKKSLDVFSANSGVVARRTRGAEAVLSATSIVATPLSTLNWTTATSGWQSVQRDRNVNGTTITLRGKTYDRGLGVNADSTITYDIAGQYVRFTADIGVDDAAGFGCGSVVFQVVADGKRLFTSGTLTGTSAVVSVDLDLIGVETLQLIATNAGDGISYTQADWADATLYADSAPRRRIR